MQIDMKPITISRVGLIVLSALGTIGGAQLSFSHLIHGEICPMIGPVPACNIVLVGYSLILLATMTQTHRTLVLFVAGWVPVSMLAITGVTLEILYGATCPPGPAGIPQCFISLAMSMLSLIFFIMFLRSSRKKS